MTSSSITGIINPRLDLTPYRESFERYGRVRIPDILNPDFAEALYQVFQSAPWSAIFRLNDEVITVSREDLAAYTPQDQMNLRARIFAETLKGYQFSYLNLALEDARGASWDRDQLLPALHDFLDSEAFRDIGRGVSGREDILSTSSIATCYMRESFLSAHNDAAESLEDRLVAYVLSFAKDWKFDWGGLLQFLDAEDGRVIDSFLPTFNALTLFRVPQLHSVSFVTPFAMGPRISVTGWYHGPAAKKNAKAKKTVRAESAALN